MSLARVGEGNTGPGGAFHGVGVGGGGEGGEGMEEWRRGRGGDEGGGGEVEEWRRVGREGPGHSRSSSC